VGDARNTVVRIDPETNRVVARIKAQAPSGIAAGAGAVWVVTRDERVLRIDPETNTVSRVFVLPSEAAAPVFGGGSLWLIVYLGAGNVWRFDPATLTVSGTTSTSPGTTSLALGAGAVWAGNPDGTLWRLDPVAVAPVAKIVLGSHPADVAVGSKAVWVAFAPAT
jgi:DNA-binding beta-propeller fold protein YncE